MDKLICPNCKAENDPKNQFCLSCGTPLQPPAGAEADKTVMGSRAETSFPPPPPPTPGQIPPMPGGYSTPPAYNPPPSTGYAQQQPYEGYAPQPPAGYGYPPAPMYMGTPIAQLGIRQDGWNDIVEGAADLADEVKEEFVTELKAAEIPGVQVVESTITDGQGEPRQYQLIHNGRGATIAVRVAAFGKNLFVGWDLFTKRTVNWLTIGLLGGIVLILCVLDSVSTSILYRFAFYSTMQFFGNLLTWLLTPGLAILLLGKIIKDDWLAFYVKNMSDFAADDAMALSTVVDNALSHAVEKCKSDAPKSKK